MSASASPYLDFSTRWHQLPLHQKVGFQESWTFQIHDPLSRTSLWVRAGMLRSKNGFREVCETTGVFTIKRDAQTVTKQAFHQIFDRDQLVAGSNGREVRVGKCEFGSDFLRGEIQWKGKILSWDLKLERAARSTETPFPELLPASGPLYSVLGLGHRSLTDGTWLASGKTEIDGLVRNWSASPVMISHESGPKLPHRWIRCQSQSFTEEGGKPADFSFEGISAWAKTPGGVLKPRISSLCFRYQGTWYAFNRWTDLFKIRSRLRQNEWKFRVEHGPLSFHGLVKSNHRDFAGLTWEDTEGTLRYCAQAPFTELKIVVYRHGKWEASFVSDGMAALEWGDSEKSPYVPLLT